MESLTKADMYYLRWKNLPWKKFFSRKTYLQSQIHYFRKLRNFSSLYRTQNTILNSKACHYIAVQKVNSVYIREHGLCMTYKRRFKLIKLLQEKRGDAFYLSNLAEQSFTNEYIQEIEHSIREFLWRLAIEPAYINFDRRADTKEVLDNVAYRKIRKHTLSAILCLNWRRLLIQSQYKVLIRKISCPIKHKIAFYKNLNISFLEMSRNGLKIGRIKYPLVYFLFCGLLNEMKDSVLFGKSFIYKDYLFYKLNNLIRPSDIVIKLTRLFHFKNSSPLLKNLVWIRA